MCCFDKVNRKGHSIIAIILRLCSVDSHNPQETAEKQRCILSWQAAAVQTHFLWMKTKSLFIHARAGPTAWGPLGERLGAPLLSSQALRKWDQTQIS